MKSNREVIQINNKRKLLLAISGTSVATVWQKPVVNGVLLPGHAQTTTIPGDDQTTGMCPPLLVSERNLACTDADPVESTYFVVEEFADSCPQIASRAERVPQPVATLIDINLRRFYGGASVGVASINITSVNPDGTGSGSIIRSRINDCDEEPPFTEFDFDQTPFEITGTMGGTYTLTAQKTTDTTAGTMRVFNIEIQ